jgi:hypothetical protein
MIILSRPPCKTSGDELLQASLSGERDEMAHQRCSDALPLMLVNDGEGDLRPSGFDDEVAAAAHDPRLATLLRNRDEGDVNDLLVGEVAAHREEAAVQRLRAGTALPQ